MHALIQKVFCFVFYVMSHSKFSDNDILTEVATIVHKNTESHDLHEWLQNFDKVMEFYAKKIDESGKKRKANLDDSGSDTEQGVNSNLKKKKIAKHPLNLFK